MLEIKKKIRVFIYCLSIIFMPMGFLVGIYLITHEDEEYNKIGEMIIRILAMVLLCFAVLYLMIFLSSGTPIRFP